MNIASIITIFLIDGFGIASLYYFFTDMVKEYPRKGDHPNDTITQMFGIVFLILATFLILLINFRMIPGTDTLF